MIRKELEKHERWKFTGSLDGIKIPVELSTLICWIVFGPNVALENQPKTRLSKTSSIVSQIMVQSFKSKRQVRYEPNEDCNHGLYNTIETPSS